MSTGWVTRRFYLKNYGINYVQLCNLKSLKCRQANLRFISCSQFVFSEKLNDGKKKNNSEKEKGKKTAISKEPVIKGK